MIEKGISGRPGCVLDFERTCRFLAFLVYVIVGRPLSRAVFRPNMRPECLVLAIRTNGHTLWHALDALRCAKGAFRASLGAF
jgi:hypothetical protein